jgi:hypothetical protein
MRIAMAERMAREVEYSIVCAAEVQRTVKFEPSRLPDRASCSGAQ